MDYEVRWPGPALAELEALVEYIAKRSPDTAQRVGEALFNHVRILRSFPNIGPVYRVDARGTIRQITYKTYRIFYRVFEADKYVRVLAVRHGSRDETINLD